MVAGVINQRGAVTMGFSIAFRGDSGTLFGVVSATQITVSGSPVSVLNVLEVAEEGEEVEDGGEEIGAADDAGDGLGVDGVDGEEEDGEFGGAGGEEGAGELGDEDDGEEVEGDVGDVVAGRLEAAEGVVEPEGHHAEGTVGAVRGAGAQRRPPEVVRPDVQQRRRRQHVRVAQNRPAETDKQRRTVYFSKNMPAD